ncbi:hypothetical protein [Pseudoalteromonas xiamenensis]|uniref:Uncharacterized protein n=1 Tax=Pseudoalteromonas xiamenensis TaxID=882626 RepID=A0A975HKW4_9GAMM|nr:hypothetical protein [Pseudoalteromonas xiamenensis]QTH71337.1 hypothetical protein J5O05_16355 [Pseudoalteromonas xiamenensis]WMN59710.1 hypothetical protein NI389_16250 [Pseudoalteromonas xiamenensis]
MFKSKSTLSLTAVVDDVKASPFTDIQKQLDLLQDNGMTALDIRNVLFHKMLDLHAVPKDHFLRDADTPERLDDPAILTTLNELGFHRKARYPVH